NDFLVSSKWGKINHSVLVLRGGTRHVGLAMIVHGLGLETESFVQLQGRIVGEDAQPDAWETATCSLRSRPGDRPATHALALPCGQQLQVTDVEGVIACLQ